MFCSAGCVVRGAHADGCRDRECRGCLPRPAESGVLCRFCFQRLVGAVVDVPGVHAHLASMAAEGVSSGAAGEHAGGRSVPGSRVLYPPALMAAEELAALLGSWADEVVRLHPDGVTPPSDWGWRWSSPVRAVDRETGEAFMPSAARVSASQSAVEALVRWLLPYMAWVSRQSWAVEMSAEVNREVSTAKARWPIEERVHHVPMPCPYCGRRALVYSPPSQYQCSAMVTCENQDCGRIWLDDSWTKTVALVLAHPELIDEVA